MKRAAILLMSSLAAGVLYGGLAYGDPLGDAVPDAPAVPALPDAGGLVATAQETLAGVGLPLDAPALPALPALPDAASALATVTQTLADTGLGLPTQDPVLAVPENIIVGNGNEAVERVPLYLSAVPGVSEVTTMAGDVTAMAQEAVAGLGLPLDDPAVPALPDPTSLVATVAETVAGLGLPLGLPDL
jgi:hypothetical protein